MVFGEHAALSAHGDGAFKLAFQHALPTSWQAVALSTSTCPVSGSTLTSTMVVPKEKVSDLR
jgi:hypothetical protein